VNSESTESDLAPDEAEAHRAFVREIHRGLASVYAWGGGLVVVSAAALLVGGWYRGILLEPLLWVGTVLVGLVGLLVVRWLVYRRADQLWERVRGYCRANDVEPGALRTHFGDDPMYQFFDALFELRERRRRSGDDHEPEADEE